MSDVNLRQIANSNGGCRQENASESNAAGAVHRRSDDLFCGRESFRETPVAHIVDRLPAADKDARVGNRYHHGLFSIEK